MNKFKTVDFVLCSLNATILCILAPVSIPLGFTPIPITLGLFVVIMAGIILGATRGSICVLIYILLGTIGMPVFSGYIGGIQRIFSPTGGYILGYILLVWICGYFTENFAGKWYMCFIGTILGTVLCYIFGTIWMSMQLQISFTESLWMGVIPFLPFDILKIIFAIIICCPIRVRLIQENLIHLR